MERTGSSAAAATTAPRPGLGSSGGHFEFLTREERWVEIPQDRITFLPIPGDQIDSDTHHAHLCYRPATEGDGPGSTASNVFDDIYLYCAFIPPGTI